MDIYELMNDVTDAIVEVDASRIPFRSFKPGVGPYGEPQLLKLIVAHLNHLPEYKANVVTKRTPDLLIPDDWAVEFKIVRPFGDNGKEAEDWSVNLLHPYPGNVSSIGDCLKLMQLQGSERKSVAVIGYEHAHPKISLTPLIDSFEVICEKVIGVKLSKRVENYRRLDHPVHQAVRVFAWEVLN